jgi:hypothetical protein
MVSVHNSSLFDELREDAISHLPDSSGGSDVDKEPLYDELDDQFEEDVVINTPRLSKLNMKNMASSASNYFANKTSPQSNKSPNIESGLLDSARSTKSISSVVSQRHHGRLFFPDKRNKNQHQINSNNNNSNSSRRSPPRNLKQNALVSNITNGTQRIRQRVVEGQELINRRRHAQKPKSPIRDTSPIAIRKGNNDLTGGIVMNQTRPSPPKSWDTTRPLDYSPTPIKRLPVPRQVPVISKEEKIFRKARERTLRTQSVNRRRKEMEDKKIKDTETKVKKRFEKHEERLKSRKDYEAVERRRRLKDREDRAMSNMESYFAQRNDKALTAALKQNMGRRSRAHHSNRYGNGGSRVYDDSDAQSRHTMHTLAKKKLAILEQDRLDKLLQRVEQQDRRIEKLEKEKARARRRQADLRAREGRELGYRAQWARRNRGGLRTAGASSIYSYGDAGRSPSAMSTRSEQPYSNRRNQNNGNNNRPPRRDVISAMAAPMSAPIHGNHKNKTLDGDNCYDGSNGGVIIKRKDSKWFTEEDENDGVIDEDVVEDPQAFYYRQQQQQYGSRQQQYRADDDNRSQTTTSTQDNINTDDLSNTTTTKVFEDQLMSSKSNNATTADAEYNANNNALRHMDQLSDSLDGLSQQGDNTNIDLSYAQHNQILNKQNLEEVQLEHQQHVAHGNTGATDASTNHSNDKDTGKEKISQQQKAKRISHRRNNLTISTSNVHHQITFEERQQLALQQQQLQHSNVIPYGSEAWYYIDVQGIAQGPFTDHQMLSWHGGNFFTQDLKMRRGLDANTTFQPMGDLFPEFEKAFQEGQGPCPAIQHTSRQYTGRF